MSVESLVPTTHVNYHSLADEIDEESPKSLEKQRLQTVFPREMTSDHPMYSVARSIDLFQKEWRSLERALIEKGSLEREIQRIEQPSSEPVDDRRCCSIFRCSFFCNDSDDESDGEDNGIEERRKSLREINARIEALKGVIARKQYAIYQDLSFHIGQAIQSREESEEKVRAEQLERDNKVLRGRIERLEEHSGNMRKIFDSYEKNMSEGVEKIQKRYRELNSSYWKVQGKLREYERKFGEIQQPLEELRKKEQEIVRYRENIASLQKELRKSREESAEVTAQLEKSSLERLSLVERSEFEKQEALLKAFTGKYEQLHQEKSELDQFVQKYAAEMREKKRVLSIRIQEREKRVQEQEAALEVSQDAQQMFKIKSILRQVSELFTSRNMNLISRDQFEEVLKKACDDS